MNHKLVLIFLMCIVFGVGCNSDVKTEKMDEETFLKNFDSTPTVIVSKDDLPEWLAHRVDFFETGDGTGISQQLKVFRGKWNGRMIFFLEFLSNCRMCDVYFENGEQIVWSGDGRDSEKFCTESKDWTLIYQIEPSPR